MVGKDRGLRREGWVFQLRITGVDNLGLLEGSFFSEL